MYSYNILQWLIFFYIYCFIGWCIESAIVSVTSKKFVNRGFLRSPLLPIYGFGAIVILFVTLPVKDNPVLVYVFGMVGTTALEFITGWIMEKLLKMKYWDYSDRKFNVKGYICLKSSLFWGVLSLFLIYVIHNPIENMVLGSPTVVLVIVDTAVSVLFVSDLVYAIRTALDVNKILAAITQIKEEIAKTKEELAERFEETEAAAQLNAKIEKLRAERKRHAEKLGFFKKDYILAHPTARSQRFNEALEDLREYLAKRK
ncbi:MAG: EscU/YscU/HrcU family type III secretion system export apparatus switch protein [Oscillospiraceae bacterium]